MNKTRQPTAVDLFSGCGGLTLGLQQAGYKVLAAVEVEIKAQATYALNHPDVTLYRKDIRFIKPCELMDQAGLKRGELDLLAGCPPCQGFSRLRTKNRAVFVQDSRNDLVNDFLRFVKILLPKKVMLENVPALMRDSRFVELCSALELLGYNCAFDVLDAADYGVPQRRRRLILVASRDGKPVIAVKNSRRFTVREALEKVGAPSTSKDLLHSLPERRSEAVRTIISMIPKNGGSRSDLPVSFQLPCHLRSRGFYDVYGRMSWDEVAPTITSGCHNPSKGRFIHPSYNRNITLREAALLQGFPISYQFDISHGKEAIALMIGNALPPPFIAAHAMALRG